MTANGPPRRRTRARRVLKGVIRVAALLAIIVGLGSVLAPAMALRPEFYAVALLFAVSSFVLLQPRRVVAPPAEPAVTPEPVLVVDEAKIAAAREEERERWAREVSSSVDAVRRTKQELAASEEGRAALKHNLEELTQTILGLRQETANQDAANQRITRADASIAGLNKELAAAREAAEQQQRAAAQREADWSDKLRKALEGLKGDHQRDAAQRDSRLHELQRALESERGIREQVAALARELQQQVTADAAAQGDLHRSLDQERTAREQAEAATKGERVARESIEAHARDLATRVVQIEEQVEALERERDEQLAAKESEWSDKLETIADGVSGNHETEIASVVAERDALTEHVHDLQEQIAKREIDVASLTARMHALQEQLASRKADITGSVANASTLQQAIESEPDNGPDRIEDLERRLAERDTEWNEKLQSIVTGMASDHEQDLGEKIEQRESARAEVRSLSGRVQQLQRELAAKETEWNEKLQKIATGMAADHEDDVGEATMEREASRAEARHLTLRLQELQRQFDEQRANIDNEWSEKLQTIVTHLASDHEADIGKAFEEKEAAKAEVRTLNVKLNKLEKQMENERQMFLVAEEKWNALRDALRHDVDELRRRSAPPPPPPPAPATAPASAAEPEPFPTFRVPTPEPFSSPFASAPPADAGRARPEVLEIAEQAHAVLKRTAPETIPVPHVGPRPLILFVHHDPTMRTMWRDQLHKHGYDVIIAADGLEGLRLAKAQKPGVVIADAQMPKMDGRELCQMIKSNEQTANTKVILMSGMVALENPTEGFQPDELVRKPVKFDALQAALTNVLSVRTP